MFLSVYCMSEQYFFLYSCIIFHYFFVRTLVSFIYADWPILPFFLLSAPFSVVVVVLLMFSFRIFVQQGGREYKKYLLNYRGLLYSMHS